MIKLNSKGFFLAETIVVIGIVAAVLVLFYSQISSFYRNYERRANYNTVEAVHAGQNIKTYMQQNYADTLLSDLYVSDSPLLDITSYSFDTTGYYNALVSTLNAKKIYFAQYNINNVIDNYATYNINASLLKFLQTLRVKDDVEDIYRIIVLLNNGDYANTFINYEAATLTLLSSQFASNEGGTYELKNGSNYFVGAHPNNWIQFGSVSATDSTPLLWRVIKSDTEGIKIIYEGIKNGVSVPNENGTFGSYPWDTAAGHLWNTASLNTILQDWYNNTLYVNNKTSYVAPILWCNGQINSPYTITEFKAGECSTKSSSTSAVGLIQASDFISTSPSTSCNAYNQTICSTSGNFLYKPSYHYWTLNSQSGTDNFIWKVYSSLSLVNSDSSNIYVRPVINLKSGVLWAGGTGSLSNPFRIKVS